MTDRPASQTDYHKLLDYIPYFADSSNQFVECTEMQKNEDGSFSFPYCSYSEMVREFEKTVYDTEFIFKGDYLEGISGKATDPAFIERCDLETLRKIMTSCVRGERFCEGHLASVIENGLILKVLKRLEELIDRQ